MFSSKSIGVGVFLFHLISNQYLEAVPVTTPKIEQIPWDQPCMPNMRGLRSVAFIKTSTIATVNLQTDEHVANVKTKTVEAIQTGKALRQKLIDIFGDDTISESIRTRNLVGFPQVVPGNKSQNQSVSSRFRKMFTQLSRAAVFLDYNRRNLQNGELKDKLDLLIQNNLSVMCEMQFILQKLGLSQPDPANRSIMGNLPKSMSTFKKNEFCLNTMFKYDVLLNGHLTEYRRISKTTN